MTVIHGFLWMGKQMNRKVVARLAVGTLSAAAIVLGVQDSSTADSWHCTANGQECIREQLGGLPGGSIIWARFNNNDSAGNYASVQLWATDINWQVGAKPTVGETLVAAGDTLDYGSNFLPWAGEPATHMRPRWPSAAEPSAGHPR